MPRDVRFSPSALRNIALSGVTQIIASALLRVITLFAFYALPLSINQTAWISDFFLPAGLMVFFAFLGSLWSVAGVTLGSFLYIILSRNIPWDIAATASLPSSFALLFTMAYLYITLPEEVSPSLPIRLTWKRITIVSTVYAFFNAMFFYMAFLVHFDYFQDYVSFDYTSLGHLFIGDVLGGILVLGTIKAVVRLLVYINDHHILQRHSSFDDHELR